MLVDLEDHSFSSEVQIDKHSIIPGKIIDVKDKEEVIFNVIVAECLRGIAFNNVGDVINLCAKQVDLGTSYPSVLTNIATDNEQIFCTHKYKARVVATSRKFPGFFKFSGYKQINLLCPDVVMSKRQLGILVKDTLKHFPKFEAELNRKVKEVYPASTEEMPKSKLYIRVSDSVSRHARNTFKNDLLNQINDEQIYIFDSFSFAEDIKTRMVILQVLNSIISIICYIMGLF